MKNRWKRLLFLIFVLTLCILAGIIFHRRTAIHLPENPRVYEQKIHEDGYAYLTYQDKIFVPYCACEARYLGQCIGYYDVPATEYTDAFSVYVCELKGYSPDMWIIDWTATDCPEGMIWREINTTEIPGGLTSEYEWNLTKH